MELAMVYERYRCPSTGDLWGRRALIGRIGRGLMGREEYINGNGWIGNGMRGRGAKEVEGSKASAGDA